LDFMIFRSSTDPERLETKMPQWQIGNIPSQAKDKGPAALRGRATTYTKRTFTFAPRTISTESHLTLGFTRQLGTHGFEHPPRVRAEVLQASFIAVKCRLSLFFAMDGMCRFSDNEIATESRHSENRKFSRTGVHSDVSQNV